MSRRDNQKYNPRVRTIKKEVKRLLRERLSTTKVSYAGSKTRPGLVFHGQKAPKWSRYRKGKNSGL